MATTTISATATVRVRGLDSAVDAHDIAAILSKTLANSLGAAGGRARRRKPRR